MKDNVITIVTPYDIKKNKSTFTTSLHSACHQYGIKFQYVNQYDVFSGKVLISDPFLMGDFFTPRFLERMEKLSPKHRIILTTDTLKGLHQYASVIGCNPVRIAREIFSYCVAAGRRRLALFAYDRFALNTPDFTEAYMGAAKDFGCALDEKDVFLNDEKQIFDCFSRFYEKITSYNAVVCANDMAALHLITELRQRGVRVPEDIFVIGFGNSPISHNVSPAITSVALSEKEKAEQCVALWRYLRKHPEVYSVNITLGHKLVVRESTAGFLPAPEEKRGMSSFSGRGEDRGYGSLIPLQEFLQSADGIEKEIVSRMLAGKSNAEIGEEIFLSDHAVKYRITKLMKRFEVSSREEICQIFRHYNVHL